MWGTCRGVGDEDVQSRRRVRCCGAHNGLVSVHLGLKDDAQHGDAVGRQAGNGPARRRLAQAARKTSLTGQPSGSWIRMRRTLRLTTAPIFRSSRRVDGESLATIEAYGVARMLEEVQQALNAGRYRPTPGLRRHIPKADGSFLGCHLHKRVLGCLLGQGRRVYFLHRWPSSRAMQRVRRRLHELTDRRWCGVKDIRVVIRNLNPVLRGWGNYFRTGNAAEKLSQVDRYVEERLRSLMITRRGRNLHAGQAQRWTRAWFEGPVSPARHHPISGSRVTMPRSPPVRGVRENRTHGLKGSLDLSACQPAGKG